MTIRSVLGLLVLSAALSVAQTPHPVVPDTPPGRLLAAWLAAFNSPDPSQLQKFNAEHRPVRAGGPSVEQRDARDAEFREMTGGFDLVKVEEASATEITAIVKEKRGVDAYAKLVLHVDEKSPNVLAGMELQRVPVPQERAPAKLSIAQLTDELDALLTQRTHNDEFSGVVLIAKDGNPLWQKAYGLAERSTGKPNQVTTKFNVGSMDKMFTSVAIGQLVQAGKLKYSDTLASVLPDYPNQEIARKITIAQLLSHTSGMGDIFGPEYRERRDSIRAVKDFLPIFVNKPLQFEPGKGHAYSNAGYVVLGLVIEKISGENYYDYIQKHVFDVAGMKHTGFTPRTPHDASIAISYSRKNTDHKPIDVTETQPWRGFPAGGGESTVGDLLLFDQAFRSHKLLNAELTQAMITPRSEVGPNFGYGYGMGILSFGDRKIVGHNGGAPGVSVDFNMYLESGYTVVVLANCDPPAADEVTRYIRERLP